MVPVYVIVYVIVYIPVYEKAFSILYILHSYSLCTSYNDHKFQLDIQQNIVTSGTTDVGPSVVNGSCNSVLVVGLAVVDVDGLNVGVGLRVVVVNVISPVPPFAIDVWQFSKV